MVFQAWQRSPSIEFSIWQFIVLNNFGRSTSRIFCRIFGKCLTGDFLEGEIGTVIGQGIPNVPKLFTYVRYNAELSRDGLDALGLERINPVHVQQKDSVDHIDEMQELGQTLAQQKVKAKHFSGFPATITS